MEELPVTHPLSLQALSCTCEREALSTPPPLWGFVLFSCSFMNFALANPQLFQRTLRQVAPDSPLQAGTVTGEPLQQAGTRGSGTRLFQGSRESTPEEVNISQGARGLGSCSGTAPRPGPSQVVAQLYTSRLSHSPEVTGPLCPPRGLILQDLTFVHLGNPDYIDGKVNFSKRWQQFNILDGMRCFQQA